MPQLLVAICNMKRIYRYLLNIENYKLSLLVIFSLFLFNLAVAIFISFVKNNVVDKSPVTISFVEKFITNVLIAPLLETLIYQTLIIALSKKLRNNNLFAVLISSFLFGISHYTSIETVLRTFIMGFILSLYYTVLRAKKINGYYPITLIHSFWNLFSLILLFFTSKQ
jgi:membrane protease YdiL (CAAX protease family)